MGSGFGVADSLKLENGAVTFGCSGFVGLMGKGRRFLIGLDFFGRGGIAVVFLDLKFPCLEYLFNEIRLVMEDILKRE